MTDWSKKTKKRPVSTKTAIACGMIPEITNGSLWKFKKANKVTSLGRSLFGNNSSGQYRLPDGAIVMVYNVEYHPLKMSPRTTEQIWNIIFSFLFGEKAYENESLWHDEWLDVFEKAGPIDE